MAQPWMVVEQEEVEAIHRATLRLLEEVGIVLTEPQAVEILCASGAWQEGKHLFLPADLVERALEQCPEVVRLRGREQEVVLGDGSLHWHNLGGARDVYDPASGQRRPAMVQDVRDSARLLDALGSVSSITPLFTPQDVPGPLMSLAMYRYTLPHTTRAVHGPGVQTAAEVRIAARMAEVIGPPAEVLSLGISPVSPLSFPNDVAAAMIECARLGVTLSPLPCPIAGATAPVTLAGALVQQNAEVLASVVLAQLVRPGLPMVYCGRLAMMEPRTGLSVWGGVELGVVSAATVQIGHRYRLPVNVYGLSTNAHTLDLQNGYERGLNALLPALAGADELSGIGEMEAGVLSSFTQLVLDDEIAASVLRARRGFIVDEESLAVQVIGAAMAGPGNFLAQRHTARHLRREVFVTRLAERGGWEEWERRGREGMVARAQAEAERLLVEHQVPPLSVEQERELEAIMAAAERELVGECA